MIEPEQFWTLRPMRDGDRNFVVKSWLTTYESSAPHTKSLRLPYMEKVNRQLAAQCRDAWLVQTDPILEQIVEQSTVLVACHQDEPEVILAFAIFQVHETGPLVIHWVYTRSRYRGMKVANSLIREAVTTLPHNGTVIASNTAPCARQQIQRRGYEQVPMFAFIPTKRFRP